MGMTDEVRRLLDEHGVEYETADSYRCKFTLWRNNGIDAGWDDSENWEQPHLLIIGFTPEQAIAATLGRGECKAVYRPEGVVCSECGGGGLTVPRLGVKAFRNFCPNCGRRVKVVDE